MDRKGPKGLNWTKLGPNIHKWNKKDLKDQIKDQKSNVPPEKCLKKHKSTKSIGKVQGISCHN